MRSSFATHNLLAVSAITAETALNTEQTLDTGMLVDLASVIKYEARRETNADEAIGKEEPDAVYDLGALASLDLSFARMQAQHAAFIMAYALGLRTTVAGGSTGYKHTITPITGDLDASRSNPSFTGAMRYGKHLLKERYASFLIDSFTLSLKKDSWASIKAACPSTGKRSSNNYEESKTAAYNASSLTLAANGVAGSTVQERLDNVHFVKVQVPATLQWVDVTVTAVSDASPAILTITPVGGAATSTTYKIIYNIKEDATYAWCSFPARVSEPPLRCSDFSVNFGGLWNGSAILGGHTLQTELKSLDWAFTNGIKPEFTPGGGTYSYANRALRDGRTQKLTLDRNFKDMIIGQRLLAPTDHAVIRCLAEGAEYEAGHKYTVEVIFPKVGVLADDRSIDGKRLGEKGDFVIFEDDTYGSVIVNVKNKVATYAA